jgi:hypothetical protein
MNALMPARCHAHSSKAGQAAHKTHSYLSGMHAMNMSAAVCSEFMLILCALRPPSYLQTLKRNHAHAHTAYENTRPIPIRGGIQAEHDQHQTYMSIRIHAQMYANTPILGHMCAVADLRRGLRQTRDANWRDSSNTCARRQ